MVPINKAKFLINKMESECACKGYGCNTCKAKSARMMAYTKADIPIEYWDKSWKNFQGSEKFKTRVKSEILERITDVYTNGESFIFKGTLGIGKTYAATVILKMAIVNNYSAFYINMSEIIDYVTRNDTEIVDKLMETDFLVIDEFDLRWVYPSEQAERLFGQTLERVLRIRFQNQLPTIICSNTVDIETVLGDTFKESIDSLFSKFAKTIVVTGKDFRKK